MKPETHGKIILLNGASSAGKSTLSNALQDQLDEPFLQFSLDFFFFESKVLPKRREESGPFAWPTMRPKLLEGYYKCLPALAAAGNNLVIDHILETAEQLATLVQLLADFDVFFVGVHCPLEELERRERLRGDRGTGDARRDFNTVHTFSAYDTEVDSTEAPSNNATRIVTAWTQRSQPTVFAKLAQLYNSDYPD